MKREDLARTGANMTEILTTFVQTHLISSGKHWMKRKTFEDWTAVKKTLTAILYDIIVELLRIQSRHDALHQGNQLKAIADTVGDTMLQDAMTIHGFSILSKLNAERDISHLAGVILNVLRARWNTNSITPQLWTQGHQHRRVMYIAGTIFDSSTHPAHGRGNEGAYLPALQPATHISLTEVEDRGTSRSYGGTRKLPPGRKLLDTGNGHRQHEQLESVK